MRGKKWPLILFVLFLARLAFFFYGKEDLSVFAGKQIKVSGRISSESLLQDNYQRFKLGQVDVYADRYPSYSYGDYVQVSGSLQARMINNRQSQFRLMYPNITLINQTNDKTIGQRVKGGLLAFKQRLMAVFQAHLPEPEASLLSGIVLGAKKSLPADFYQALRDTSTLHIVVASGYNITVLMGVVVAYLAGVLKRKQAIIVGAVVVAAYTVMAGGEPAIVRAAIMGILLFWSQVVGRPSDGVRLLVLAALAMILVKPDIIFDLGFQLSMAATWGLLSFSDKWGKLAEIRFFGKNMAESLSAQLAVLPIILINFGQMSVFGILVNVLILWLVPIIMGLGGMLALVGMAMPILAAPVSWLTYVPLTAMVRVIEWFGGQPLMNVQIDGVSWWWGVGYYLALGLWLKLKRY